MQTKAGGFLGEHLNLLFGVFLFVEFPVGLLRKILEMFVRLPVAFLDLALPALVAVVLLFKNKQQLLSPVSLQSAGNLVRARLDPGITCTSVFRPGMFLVSRAFTRNTFIPASDCMSYKAIQ